MAGLTYASGESVHVRKYMYSITYLSSLTTIALLQEIVVLIFNMHNCRSICREVDDKQAFELSRSNVI
jgi:hypothetical protein